jgi:predicted transcriptional regulator
MKNHPERQARRSPALPEEVDALAEQARVVAAVQQGLAEAEAGLLISDEQLGRELEQEFGPLSG